MNTKVRLILKTIISILLTVTFAHQAFASEATNQEQTNHKHATYHGSHELSLNHGDKWKLDEHTRKMFELMTERLETEAELKAVGTLLNDDLQKLIQGCTMTGAAHDQLHLFLTPFMPAVKTLSQEGSKAALHEVKHTLQNYKNYFE